MNYLFSQASHEMSFLRLRPVLVLSGCLILLVISVTSVEGL